MRVIMDFLPIPPEVAAMSLRTDGGSNEMEFFY